MQYANLTVTANVSREFTAKNLALDLWFLLKKRFTLASLQGSEITKLLNKKKKRIEISFQYDFFIDG